MFAIETPNQIRYLDPQQNKLRKSAKDWKLIGEPYRLAVQLLCYDHICGTAITETYINGACKCQVQRLLKI
jgi:hypothetical protein